MTTGASATASGATAGSEIASSPSGGASSGGGALFDNPIYETDGKKVPSGEHDVSKDVISHEMKTIAILRWALMTHVIP